MERRRERRTRRLQETRLQETRLQETERGPVDADKPLVARSTRLGQLALLLGRLLRGLGGRRWLAFSLLRSFRSAASHENRDSGNAAQKRSNHVLYPLFSSSRSVDRFDRRFSSVKRTAAAILFRQSKKLFQSLTIRCATTIPFSTYGLTPPQPTHPSECPFDTVQG